MGIRSEIAFELEHQLKNVADLFEFVVRVLLYFVHMAQMGSHHDRLVLCHSNSFDEMQRKLVFWDLTLTRFEFCNEEYEAICGLQNGFIGPLFERRDLAKQRGELKIGVRRELPMQLIVQIQQSFRAELHVGV